LEQARLRVAFKSLQEKGFSQASQVFQNGYDLLLFQCFCEVENFASASFNNAAMVSGDDLLAMISDKTVGGIFVVIFHHFEDRLHAVFSRGGIVANDLITRR